MYRLTYSLIKSDINCKSNKVKNIYIDSEYSLYNIHGVIVIGYIKENGDYVIGVARLSTKLYDLLLSVEDNLVNSVISNGMLVTDCGTVLNREKCKDVDQNLYQSTYTQNLFAELEHNNDIIAKYTNLVNIIENDSKYIKEKYLTDKAYRDSIYKTLTENIKDELKDKIIVIYAEGCKSGNCIIGTLEYNILKLKKTKLPIEITDDILNVGKRLDVVFNNYIYKKYGKLGKQIIDAYVFKNYDNNLLSAILDFNKLDAINLDDFYTKALKETANIDNMIVNSNILSLTDRTIMMEFSISTLLNDRNTTFNILMSQKKELKAKITDLYNEAIHNARYTNKLAPLKFYKIDSMRFVGYILYVTLVIKVSNMDSNVDVLDTLKH